MKRLRPLFTFAAVTAIAGSVTAFLALSPIPRLVAAVLLLAALAATVAGLAELRKRRHERLFIRQSVRAYAPYVAVAAILLAGLRMWIVLMPPRPTPLLKLPPAEQGARISADAARLSACWDDAGRKAEELGKLSGSPTADGRLEAELAAGLVRDLAECEGIYDYYKGFTHIDVVSQPWLHAEAFALGYAAFLQRLAILIDLADRAEKPGGERIFASRELAGRAGALSDDATALRLYAGHAYLQTQTDFIRNERIKALLGAKSAVYDRFPEIVSREVKNPLRILRRYANARP